jgi:predicted nuclease of predicted toxin-antitoxin system
MLRLLIDQDLDHDILRGLIRRIPQLDVVTAFEIGMREATDAQLLIRAAQEGRIIVTHDRQTMPTHAAHLMSKGEISPDFLLCFAVCRFLKCLKTWG